MAIQNFQCLINPSPLGCDHQPKWAGVKRLMEASEHGGVDDAPCAKYDEQLSQTTNSMVNEYEDIWLDFAANRKHESFTLCWDLSRDFKEDTFCLYGYISVTACFVRQCLAYREKICVDEDCQGFEFAPHRCRSRFKASSGTSVGIGETCAVIAKLLVSHLVAHRNLFEFLPDSGWGWTANAMWQLVGEAYAIDWKSDDAISAIAQAELAAQNARSREAALHTVVGALPKAGEIHVFALGMHTGLLREPLMALRSLLNGSPPELKIRTPCGGDGLCGKVPGEGCGPPDAAFMDIVGEHISKKHPIPGHEWSFQAIDSVRNMRLSFLKAYGSTLHTFDLLICSEPLAFCTFFEESLSPTIAYIGNEPLFYVQSHDYSFVLESVHHLSLSWRNTFLGISPTIPLFMEQHAATPFLTATPLSMHVGEYIHSYNPNRSESFGNLLVSKRIEMSFDIKCMIYILLQTCGVTPSLRVVHMGEMSQERPEYRSFAAWSQFRAALFLPMDWLQMAIYDMYAIALPIFVPDEARLPGFVFGRNIARQWDFKQPHMAPLRHNMTLNLSTHFPYRLPFADIDDSYDMFTQQVWDGMRAWTHLTDFASLPHLRRFTTYAKLYFDLQDLEGLRATSRAMVESHNRLMSTSMLLWRSILAKALSA